MVAAGGVGGGGVFIGVAGFFIAINLWCVLGWPVVDVGHDRL